MNVSDENECVNFDCGEGDCVNQAGTFTCDCKDGYVNDATKACVGGFGAFKFSVIKDNNLSSTNILICLVKNNM